jgi:hypothetical protein
LGTKRGRLLVKPRWQDAEGASVTETVEAYVRTCIDHYDMRAKWHRRLYRLSGLLSIVIGAALPVLTAFTFQQKNLVIALAGYLVAIATGMRGFYRWDSSWVLLRQTEISISREYRTWKVTSGSIAAADRDRAAQELMDRIDLIRAKEAVEYFDGMPELGAAAAKRAS